MIDADGIGDTGPAEVDNTDTDEEGSGGTDNTGAAEADGADIDEVDSDVAIGDLIIYN